VNVADIRFHAKDTLALAHIFEVRAAKYGLWTTVVDVSTLAIPMLVGLIAMTYELGADWLKVVIGVAGTLLIVQAFLDLMSRAFKWRKTTKKALAASKSYVALNNEWDRLGRGDGDSDSKHVESLVAEENRLSEKTVKLNLTPRESRFGERYALHYYLMPCPQCKVVPKDPFAGRRDQCPSCGR
jgi:mobilome CxxCx(11)CxxC protein